MQEFSSPQWFNQYFPSDKRNKHHAYIVGGRKGLGKTNFSLEFSQSILCSDEFTICCNECDACKLYSLENHPDFYNIFSEEGKQITKDHLDSIEDKIYQSSFLGGNKVLYFNTIELMNKTASNSILKMLEEPPKDTYFILSTNRIKNINPTILSRCSEILIKTPSREEAVKWLKDQGNHDLETINLALDCASGRPMIAQEFIDKNFLELRKYFVSSISELLKNGSNLVVLADEWSKDKNTLPFQLEWLSILLMETIRFHSYKDNKEFLEDTKKISFYLGGNSNINDLFYLLNETNNMWSLVSNGTSLRVDYQLQSLFIKWEEKLGIRRVKEI